MSDYLNNNNFSPINNFGTKYGGTASRKASLLFEQKVLIWLSKFKFTNNIIIADLCDMKPTSARDKLRKLANKNLIRKVQCMSVRDNFVYILTQSGVNKLFDNYNIKSPSPWLDVTKVRDKTQATHDLCVQYFCAIQSAINATYSIKSEFELGDLPKIKGRIGNSNVELKHKPDAIIKHAEGSDFSGNWAVEYESVRKSSDRLTEIFTYHYLHSNLDDRERKYWAVHYFFSRFSDLKYYKKILNKVAINRYPVCFTHVDGGEEYDENQEQRDNFLNCFHFHHIHNQLSENFYFRDKAIDINF
ncbi:hypothetical protein RI845_13600 [Thalassotalea nanhaiensis]|uniref:MarR family transcriptional regulator n=1 Tax=Thalassotalea nanhaiensis TaxID=3065648 RepID=A0ABY9TFJ4_9GAMM|nr:hypothetical protein RI845_13600 [Colwelliaceae bacterium SQ345]